MGEGALPPAALARLPRQSPHVPQRARDARVAGMPGVDADAIAEAAGRVSGPDASRHYAIARGSAMECAAVLDVLHAMYTLDDTKYERALELLQRIVAMLTKLCR